MATSDNNYGHLEMFCIIWLNKNPNENRNTEQKLRSIVNHLIQFDDINQCEKFIENSSTKNRLIVISTGRLGKELVPKIHFLRQIVSIYIYCLNVQVNKEWSSSYPKVKGVVINVDELVSKITYDHRFDKKIEEPLAIHTYSDGGQSTSELKGKFIFSQVLIDCLLRLKSTDQDRKELIQLLKQQYQGNIYELEQIDEFEKLYQSKNILQWYTKECFFYKTLNAILRTENIHWMYLFRSFIFDIQQCLQQYQSKEIIRVYRAQLISKDELDSLKKSIDKFISINSFFSTSINYVRALSFLQYSKTIENTEKILIEIEANPTIGKIKPFADISLFSMYQQEEEVLFMIGSIFRIRNIIYDYKNQLTIVQLVLASDNDNQLKHVLNYMKQQIGQGQINLRILAKFLSKTGQFELAEKYLKRMLEQISTNDPIRGKLYKDLGELASQTGNFNESVQWLAKALEYKNITDSITSPFHTKLQKICRKWKQHGLTVAGGNGKGFELNQLYYPFSMRISDDQQSIYIVDKWNHRIMKWKLGDNYGRIVAGGNSQGYRIDQFCHPTDVIVDQKNKCLIISDFKNRRVIRWSKENQQDRRIIISDIDCCGLAINENGDLFISDFEKHEVKRWKQNQIEGKIVAGGNGKGDRLDQFNGPTFIVVDREDTIYVSDQNNHRVMKWMKGAKEGIVVAGGFGQGNSSQQLNCPEGIFVDDVGDIYVVDRDNRRVMCWSIGSKEGRIIIGGNGEGSETNQLNYPKGLAFDSYNNLYVVDCGNNRIQKFLENQQ